MSKQFGIIVSGERDRVTGAREPILQSEKKQLKYDKVLDILVDIPAVVNTDIIKDISVNLSEAKINLTKIPAYQYMIKCGYSGKWGRPSYYRPPISKNDFPYYKIIEEMSISSFRLQFGIINTGTMFNPTTNIPAHIMTIRLIITYDKLEQT